VDRYELAWAAGFFDGEGYAGAALFGRGAKTRPQARINQADADGVPAVLARFQAALGGLGRMGGPHRDVGRIDLYRWHVSSRGDVERLHELIAPWLGQVKLTQLAAALGRGSLVSTNADGSDEWRAWAAGLYDGEGCSALLHHRTHAGHMTPELSVTQSSGAGPPEVLRRFAAIVHAGAVSGPYAQRSSTKDVYRWKASARADAERVIELLWPFLGTIKRAQARSLLDTLAAQPLLPRGNPAWGRHKTHCVHGHEYASSRLRAYVSRGAGVPRRDNQSCLVCLREYARRQREKRRSAADDDGRSLSEPAHAYLLK
jgi:hypothetical protein